MYRGLPIDVRLVDVRFIGMDVRWLRWARLPGVALALKNGVTPAWSLPGLLDGRHAEVAEAINQAAGKNIISTVYIWQLRTGQRDNPTMRHLSALAAFFGVSPAYFFPGSQAGQDRTQPDLAKALRDDSVRDLALRAAGLSDRSLQAISQIIEGARSAEGLTGPDTHD
jgi:transcriptional regulator with XRE-family HTH domain